MKRITTAVLAGATVATLAYASASVLQVDSKPLQAGWDTVTCTESVDVGWGFESDSGTVRSVTIREIADACTGSGAKLFVDVDGERVGSTPITETSHTFTLDPVRTVESINDIKVQIG